MLNKNKPNDKEQVVSSTKIPIIKVNQINFSRAQTDKLDKNKQEAPIQKFHVHRLGDYAKTTQLGSNDTDQQKNARMLSVEAKPPQISDQTQ